MLKYKHILLATDFSEGTAHILDEGCELAKQMGAKISLLHVVEPLPGYGYAFIGSAEIELQLVDESKKQLAKLGKKYSIDTKNQFVEIGPPKAEITRVAEEQGVDLIIVGSHGRHGFVENLLGSTANAVVHHAKCDVLTVKIKERKK
ncbi:MAG: universal stress protein [Gammaproteobacteria bacterium]|jgi:universal stress protein A